MTEEKIFDDYHQLAATILESRDPPSYLFKLADAVLILLGRLGVARQDIEQLSKGFDEPVTAVRVVELKRKLAVMTRREEKWRKEYMRLSSTHARESVESFKEFCNGHAAGMRQMRESK